MRTKDEIERSLAEMKRMADDARRGLAKAKEINATILIKHFEQWETKCEARAQILSWVLGEQELPQAHVSRRYIIVSFKHGQNGNLCFWRPNDAGYTNDLQQAGRYTEEQVKANMSYYHNGDNVAIEETKLLFDFKMRVHLDTNYLKVRKYKKLAERGLLSLNGG